MCFFLNDFFFWISKKNYKCWIKYISKIFTTTGSANTCILFCIFEKKYNDWIKSFSKSKWTGLLCQKNLIYFLSCLLQSCFGNEKFTKEFYFLYQVASERRVLRLLSKALESTPTITSYITVDIFVQRCPKIMSILILVWFAFQWKVNC